MLEHIVMMLVTCILCNKVIVTTFAMKDIELFFLLDNRFMQIQLVGLVDSMA